MHGPQADLVPTDYLLAGVNNALAVISWQIGGDEKQPRPKPLLLPGMSDPDAPKQLGDAMTIEEFEERNAFRRPK